MWKLLRLNLSLKLSKKRRNPTIWYRDCDLNEEEIDWKKHFSLQEHAQKVPKLLFSNLNFSIDVCPQIPFCLSGRNIFSWQCKVTSLFWGTFFQWLQSCSLIEKGNHLVMTNALGLKPDSSNTKLQTNFSCLVSRYYIWKCKLREV